MIDTHCHLDLEAFDADREAVVARAVAAGVTHIIVPAIDLSNAPTVLGLAEQIACVYAAVGIHPNAVGQVAQLDDGLEILRQMIGRGKVVAVGEIGLDYYWDTTPPAAQQAAFRAQLELAAELGLPVIVHNREATADLLELLRQSPLAGRERAGVLHSFSADRAAAQIALDLGFYLGLTGPITYKNGHLMREVAAYAPLERLLVETDAPYLAPHPQRGRRNEPAYVAAVVERLAAVRRLATVTVAEQTSANARRLFGLDAFPL